MKTRLTFPSLLWSLGLILSAALRAQDLSELEAFVAAGDYAGARTVIAGLIEREPQDPVHRYNLACAEARLGFSELALESLETAVRLGFRNRELLVRDEDLATLRPKARFQAIARQLAAAPPGRPTVPKAPAPEVARPKPPERPAARPTADAGPLTARLTETGPRGLFFMTRFWAFSGSLEQKLWYFDGAGRAYLTPGGNFTIEALDRESERKGRVTLVGDKLRLEWSDGKVTESTYRAKPQENAFSWDAGIFTAVREPDWSKVSGYFEGGASFSGSGGSAVSSSGLLLRADGTFRWSRSGTVRAENRGSTATAGSAGAPEEGRWEGAGYQMTLHFADGRAQKFVAFPTPDPRDAGKVGMLFFNGSMHLPKER